MAVRREGACAGGRASSRHKVGRACLQVSSELMMDILLFKLCIKCRWDGRVRDEVCVGSCCTNGLRHRLERLLGLCLPRLVLRRWLCTGLELGSISAHLLKRARPSSLCLLIYY